MIYLDNAATSFPKAPGVPEAVYDFLKNIGANSGRSSHSLARKASSIVFETREKLGQLFNVRDETRIIFTSNATEALNTTIMGLVKEGESVITSSMEHNSVIRPLRVLESVNDVKLWKIKSDKFGNPDLKDFDQLLKKKPNHLIFTACSNVTGTIFPFEEMAEKAKKIGANVILDASQIAGFIPIDFEKSAFDVICFPGHKSLLGPTGTGVFILKEGVDFTPLKYGGTGSRSHLEHQPEFLPDKFESGTLNIAGIAGLNKALEFIEETGMDNIRFQKGNLTNQLIYGLQQFPDLEIFSPIDSKIQAGVISIVPHNMKLSQFTYELDRKEIAVRMGLQCAPLAHQTIGTFNYGGTIRITPGCFNSKEEIEITLELIADIMKK